MIRAFVRIKRSKALPSFAQFVLLGQGEPLMRISFFMSGLPPSQKT